MPNQANIYGGWTLEHFPRGDSSHVEELVANRTPESPHLSYKRVEFFSPGHPEDLCREFCSFFNSEGGVILAGVREEGKSGYKEPVGIAGTSEKIVEIR